MPIFEITSPDGTKYRVEGPAGSTQEQALAQVQAAHKAPAEQQAQPEEDRGILQNIGMGALKGASDIGTTLLRPVAAMGIGPSTDERKANLQQFFQQHANPESLSFRGGELGADIAGTAGAGGVLAKGAMVTGGAIPALAQYVPKVATALESGGFRLGGVPAASAGEMLANAGTRIAGGAVTGGAMAGAIDPKEALTGALIGGALAPVAGVAGEIGRGVKAALYDPIVNPKKLLAAALLRSVGTDNAPGVAAGLSRQAATPGVTFSAGQASGSPALAALEDTFRASNPGGPLNLGEQTNRTVLADTLRGIGQDDAAITAAKSARSEAVDALYKKAKGTTVVGDDDLAALMKRPAVQQAMQDASVNARNRGGESSLGRTMQIGEMQSERGAGAPLPEAAYVNEMPGGLVEGGAGPSLLQALRKMGGVPQAHYREILGETVNKNGRAPVGLFNKSAQGLDDLATSLHSDGFIPDHEMTVDGGVQWLRDAIRQEVEGSKVYALHDFPVHAPDVYVPNRDRVGLGESPHYSQLPGVDPVYSGNVLHELKMALDSAKNYNPMGGANKAAAGAINDASKSFNAWLEKRIPEYASAKTTFSDMSVPVNQMEVGQHLSDKLIPATSGDAPARLNAASLAKALRHPDAMAQNATGFGGARLDKIMTPDQLGAISGVSSDASRIAEMQQLGGGFGSPTARRLGTTAFIGQNFAEQAPVISRVIEALGNVPGINYATKGLSGLGSMAGKGINSKLSTRLEEMLAADPVGTRQLLSQALLKSQGQMNPALRDVLRTLPIAASSQANP